jgi:hypothetical protein
VTSPAEWWDASWTVRHRLDFSATAGGPDLDGLRGEAFPVRVRLVDERVDWDRLQSDGRDLRFVGSDGVSLLPYQVERCRHGDSCDIWVLVSPPGPFWMYYGNPNAADGQAAQAVWRDGFEAVWHMGLSSEDGAADLSLLDSTGNGHDGTLQGGLSSEATVSGAVASALAFDGEDDYVDAGEIATAGWTGIALEAWIRRDRGGSGDAVLCKTAGLDRSNYAFCLHAIGERAVGRVSTSGTDGDNVVVEAADAWSYDHWSYLVVSWDADGAEVALYADGEPVAVTPNSGAAVSDDESRGLIVAIGNLNPFARRHFQGEIDEVRLSHVGRSADWVAAQYASMQDQILVYGVAEYQASQN